MINLGLSAAQMRAYNSLLVSSHDIFARIQLLDINHNYLGDFSTRLVDGQVDVDADSPTTRSLKLTLIDPDHKLHLDANAPTDGALYCDRMIRVVYVVISPDGTQEFSCPIFCGPITKVDRDEYLINLECLGKESLSLSNLWRGKTYKKGVQKVNMIKNIFTTIAGETKFQINTKSTATLPRNTALTRESIAWEAIKVVSGTLNCQAFYDGRGVSVIRRWPSKTSWTFRERGVNGSLASSPQWGYDTTNLINAASVLGAVPKAKGKAKGAKGGTDAKKKEKPNGKFHFTYVAPNTHPLSPYGLRRGGVPQFHPAYIEDSNLRSNAECRQVAIRVVTRGLLQSIDVAFDAYVIPYLEENDMCRIVSDKFVSSFILKKFSIPLTPGYMSVGYHRNLKPSKAHIRPKRRA